MKTAKITVWIILLILTLFSVYSYFDIELTGFHTTLRIIGKYCLMAISFSAVGIIFYSFYQAIFAKHKKRKLICWGLTILTVSICITWYVWDHSPSKVVRMKEDVLYILPKNPNQ